MSTNSKCAGRGGILLVFATFLIGFVLIVAFVWLPGETESPRTTPRHSTPISAALRSALSLSCSPL